MTAHQGQPDEGGQHRGPINQEFRHSPVSARIPEQVGKGSFSTGAIVMQGNDEFIVDFLLMMGQPQRISSRVILPYGVMPRLVSALRENYTNYYQKFGGVPPPPIPQAPSSVTSTHPVPHVTPAPQQAAPSQTHPAAPPAKQAGAGASGGHAGASHPPASSGTSASSGPPPAENVPAPPAPQEQSAPQIDDIYDQLKLPDEMLSGAYANAVMIGHTQWEFWFDFITTFYPRSAVSSRVFMAAPQVPRLLETLASAYQKFERSRGHHPPG